ncbi:MAG TPA: hypothetical protein VK509_20260, partial [Polyangiales bacterium]|nr:hypothetical protein [Polyangiales bacterium]
MRSNAPRRSARLECARRGALAQLWLAALALVACSADYPEGKLLCSDDSACPTGWSCANRGHGLRCYSGSSAADRDAASTGSGRPNGRKDGGPGTDGGPRTDSDATTDSVPGTDGGSITDSGSTADGAASDSGATGDGGSVADGAMDGGDAGQAEPDAGPEPGCLPTPADPALGIFVSPAGSAVANCGSAASPCSTIAQGMDRARATTRALVYIDAGTYGETVVLLAGLTLRGGWDNIAGEWTRKCTADRAASAVIASPTEIGVIAEFAGEAALDTLTIRTKPLSSASESIYAVFARGSTTRLVLNEVTAVAAGAGDGALGTTGD